MHNLLNIHEVVNVNVKVNGGHNLLANTHNEIQIANTPGQAKLPIVSHSHLKFNPPKVASQGCNIPSKPSLTTLGGIR